MPRVLILPGLNSASGLGSWPEGFALLESLIDGK
jgi:predicted alpha/beta hydrolase family esterase